MTYSGGETSPRPEDEIFFNGAVVVARRAHDFMGYITDSTRFWARGKTVDETIGALARTHPEEFAKAIERYRIQEPHVAVDLTDPANVEKMHRFLDGQITADEAGPGFTLTEKGRRKITVTREFFEAIGGAALRPDESTE
ncbi:MAG: hypothetical protein ACREGG_01970 [Candidatus Saccharimonadales bacterium]